MPDLPNNTSIIQQSREHAACADPDFVVAGRPACVERGPTWLAQALYQPPEWLLGAVPVLVIALLALAGLGYRRHGIDKETLEEMGFYVLVILAALASTQLSVAVLEAPYWLAVVVGGLGGLLAARLFLATVGRFSGGGGRQGSCGGSTPPDGR